MNLVIVFPEDVFTIPVTKLLKYESVQRLLIVIVQLGGEQEILVTLGLS